MHTYTDPNPGQIEGQFAGLRHPITEASYTVQQLSARCPVQCNMINSLMGALLCIRYKDSSSDKTNFVRNQSYPTIGTRGPVQCIIMNTALWERWLALIIRTVSTIQAWSVRDQSYANIGTRSPVQCITMNTVSWERCLALDIRVTSSKRAISQRSVLPVSHSWYKKSCPVYYNEHSLMGAMVAIR